MTTDLEEMAAKADALLAELTTPQTVVIIRGLLNEAGVNKARLTLIAALGGLAEAQAAKREADGAERDATEAHKRSVIDAESMLTPPVAEKVDGRMIVNGDEVVSWVAADKLAWKKNEAAKDEAVIAAAAYLRRCEHEAAVARDALIVADKRLSACRADLDASIATLNALSMALPARKGGNQ